MTLRRRHRGPCRNPNAWHKTQNHDAERRATLLATRLFFVIRLKPRAKNVSNLLERHWFRRSGKSRMGRNATRGKNFPTMRSTTRVVIAAVARKLRMPWR
jgi:hypothetical protein